MVKRFVDLPLIDPVTDDYQLLIITPDATNTVRTTVGEIRSSVVNIPDSLPVKTVIFGDELKTELGALFPITPQATSPYNFSVGLSNAESTINREVVASFLHAPGFYALTIIYGKRNAGGIGNILIDGVSQGSIDFYASASSDNNVFQIPVTIVGTDLHTLRIVMSSKQAASSAYVVKLTKLSIF